MKKVIPEILSLPRLLEASLKVYEKDVDLGAFCICALLSGRRISEILSLVPGDFSIKEFRHKERNNLGEWTEIASPWLFGKFQTRKRRTASFPKVPMAPLQGDSMDARAGRVLVDYVKYRLNNQDAYVFSRGVRTYEHHIRKWIVKLRVYDPQEKKYLSDYAYHLHPHYFRHARATDLAIRYGMTAHEIKAWMDYANVQTTDRYVHIDEETLVGKMSVQNDDGDLKNATKSDTVL